MVGKLIFHHKSVIVACFTYSPRWYNLVKLDWLVASLFVAERLLIFYFLLDEFIFHGTLHHRRPTTVF